MEEIKLTQAGLSDITSISELAQLIWNQYYPQIISQDQIDYMLDKMYSSESLIEQMSTKHHLFYLIEKHSKRIGFLSVKQESEGLWFLAKFYIDQKEASKGYGKKVFGEFLQLHKPKKISLTVNRGNYKSINFYFKLGFKIARVEDFEIGQGYVMNDFIMEWKSKL